MVDDVEQEEAPVGAEWNRKDESNNAENEGNESSWELFAPLGVANNSGSGLNH